MHHAPSLAAVFFFLGVEIMPKLVAQHLLGGMEAPISFPPFPPHLFFCRMETKDLYVQYTQPDHKLQSYNLGAKMRDIQNYVAIFSHFLHYSKSVPESVLFDQMTSFPSPIHPPKKDKECHAGSFWNILPRLLRRLGLHASFFGRPCIELGMRKNIPTYTWIKCNFGALSQSMTRFLLF